jgi:glycosyltransferase involved in cell wall biosynthesis
MDLTILICNYNTPKLIENLIKSIKLTWVEIPSILVIDTGSATLDESKIQDVLYYHVGYECSHGEAVNIGFNLIETNLVLLLDSDIIFHKDILPIYNRFVKDKFTLLGKVSGDRGGKQLYPRVDPWFCFIDLLHLKEKNIKFFDPVRTKNSRTSDRVYDVGSTMFEDVMNQNLKIANVDVENLYFTHYEGMSWRTQKFDPTKSDTDIDFGGTHNNKMLYDYGIMIHEKYIEDTKNL